MKSLRLKDLTIKCNLCRRRHGQPRKNKLLFDELRGIELATGHVTMVQKQKLTVLSYYRGSKSVKLLMCQECITRIDISETAWIVDDRHKAERFRYIQNYRFKRKNEETDSRFLRVELESTALDFYSTLPAYDMHVTDIIEMNLFEMIEQSRLHTIHTGPVTKDNVFDKVNAIFNS